MDIFDKIKDEDEEEDIFDKIKKDLTISEPTQFGIGAKAVGDATLPKPVEVPSGWGISDVTTPEKLSGVEKGIIGVFGTWEAKKKAMPELQKVEDFGKQILQEANQWAEELKGIEWKETGSNIEQVAIIYERLTGKPRDEALTEIKGQKDLNVFFVNPPEKYKEAVKFHQQLIDIHMKRAEPGRDLIGQFGWAGMVAIMGTQAIDMLHKTGMVIENKVIKGAKLKSAVERIQKAYIKETGKFKDTISNNDFRLAQALNDVAKKYGAKVAGELGAVEVPQEVFLGQAGKITNLVKIIQSAGKITPEATIQIKALSPSAITQVAGQLAPALASEFLKIAEKPNLAAKREMLLKRGVKEELLTDEFVEKATITELPKADVTEPVTEEMIGKLEAVAKPEIYKGKAFRAETRIPEHGAEIIAQMDTAQQKLDYDASTTGNPIFTEAGDLAENLGIDLSKVPINDMVWVAPKMEIAEKYGEAEEYKLPQDTIVLARDEEGGSLVLKNSDEHIKEPIKPPEAVEKPSEEPPPKEPWEPMVLPTPEVPVREYDFREPTIKMYYTPKKQLLREIGAESIMKDLIERKESLMVKTPKVNKWIGEVIKEINKKATFAEKLKAKTFNLPTEQVARFRDLLNAYEESPDFLDPKTKEIFDKLRTFTKSMLNDANEMRVKAGLYPITDFGAYVPHFLTEISRAIRLDPVTRKKVEHIVGKKLPKGGNPTALQRQIGAELDHIFSKDLGKLLTTMAKYDLRDIYLAEPYAIVRAELEQLKEDRAIPQSVLNEVENYIKFDVFDYQVPIDRIINTTLKPGTDIINLFLKPFNRVLTNPIQNISSIYRQLLMGGAVAGKVRMLPRNLMQRMLNIVLYPVTDSIRGQFSAPKEVVEKIRATNIYQLSVRKFEDVPATFKAVQIGMAPYAKTHAGLTYFSNVDISARVGWNYGERMIAFTNTPKGQAYIKAYAKKHGIEEGSQKYKNLFWREGDQLEEAKEAIAKTQWEYYPTGMPRVYRGHMARAFWSLNSWWMNYFGGHAPEMFSRTRGTTGRGRAVRRIDRTNALKGLAIILGISAAIKEKTGVDPSRFLVFPFPSYIYPHLFQVMVNTYGALTAKNQKEMDTHQSKLKSNFKMLIPYSGAWRRYIQFLRGELTWKEWMFYVEQEATKSIAPTDEFPSEDIFDKMTGETSTGEDIFDKMGGNQ